MPKARKFSETRVRVDCHGGPWDASRVIEGSPKKLNIHRPNMSKQRQGRAKRNTVCATAGDSTSSRLYLHSWRFSVDHDHITALFEYVGGWGPLPACSPGPIITTAHHHAVRLSPSDELYNSSRARRMVSVPFEGNKPIEDNRGIG